MVKFRRTALMLFFCYLVIALTCSGFPMNSAKAQAQAKVVKDPKPATSPKYDIQGRRLDEGDHCTGYWRSQAGTG
ncbi:hypothetical protein GCM10010913_20000 [Paenibacillus aceti]|uniref:Uncharacterized protein n=1 Tax=Paenibacillus aceti TaxID=1820010 RepID=A0ABQ1VTK4_9BACL|nr:hypothetical protein GCM10010913_20000 [Paenibacillus aceti]